MLRVGLAGCGWWAHHAHLPAIHAHPEAQLVAAADPDPARLGTVTGILPDVTGYPTVAEMLDASSLDAIVVASPGAFHFDAARAALLAGVGALVEKPFTLHAAQARELVQLATSRRLPLAVSLPYQYTRAARAVRALLSDGALGELIAVNAVFESYTAPLYSGDVGEYLRRVGRPHAVAPLPGTYADTALSGGGHGQSQTSHVVSAVMDATDARPERISSESSFTGPRMDTANAISLRLSSGAIAGIFSSGGTPPGQTAQQSITYLGTAGAARHDLARATLEWTARDGEIGRIEPAENESAYPNGAPVTALLDAVLAVRRGQGDSAAMELTLGAGRAARAVEVIEHLYRDEPAGS